MATYRVNFGGEGSPKDEAAAELDGLTPADWLRCAIATRANGSAVTTARLGFGCALGRQGKPPTGRERQRVHSPRANVVPRQPAH